MLPQNACTEFQRLHRSSCIQTRTSLIITSKPTERVLWRPRHWIGAES